MNRTSAEEPTTVPAKSFENCSKRSHLPNPLSIRCGRATAAALLYSAMTRKLLVLAILAATLAVSASLLIREIALSRGTMQTRNDVCSLVFGSSCDAALQSSISKQFGLPLAGWQILYSGTICTLLLLGWSLGQRFNAEAKLAAFWLSTAAGVVSVCLLLAMIGALIPFCSLCSILHGLNLALAALLKQMTGQPLSVLWRRLKDAGRYVLTGVADNPAGARETTAYFLIPALVGVVLYQWIYIEATMRPALRQSSFDMDAVLDEYASAPEVDIPISAADPRIGRVSAPMQLVVFSDFECSACRRFSTVLQHLLREFDGDLSVVFKHLPLSNACNPGAKSDFHPDACQAAWAAEAARRQRSFWKFHNALFASNLKDPQFSLKTLAARQGLDVGRFREQCDDEQTRAKVQADVELANRLGLRSTPSLFLNGRPVPHTSRSVLFQLIREQLKTVDGR